MHCITKGMLKRSDFIFFLLPCFFWAGALSLLFDIEGSVSGVSIGRLRPWWRACERRLNSEAAPWSLRKGISRSRKLGVIVEQKAEQHIGIEEIFFHRYLPRRASRAFSRSSVLVAAGTLLLRQPARSIKLSVSGAHDSRRAEPL